MCLPLTYRILRTKNKESRTTTVNISRGGLLFSAKRPVSLNSKIIIHMPFLEKSFNIKARVVHCAQSPETHFYNIGVCFDKFRDAFKVKLIEQMYLILEYRDLKSIQIGKEISLQVASREWIKLYSERFKRLYW